VIEAIRLVHQQEQDHGLLDYYRLAVASTMEPSAGAGRSRS
jgi:hypothetical protein